MPLGFIRYPHSADDVFPEFVQNGVEFFGALFLFHDDTDRRNAVFGHKKTPFSRARKKESAPTRFKQIRFSPFPSGVPFGAGCKYF